MQFQQELRFQVGLVEAGEHRACVVGHKQRVQVVVAAIQGLVATASYHLDDVLALAQIALRNDDVLVAQDRFHTLAVHADHLFQLLGRALEIQLQVLVARPREAHDLRERHRQFFPFGDGERQLIVDVADVGSAVVGQCFRHTSLGRHGLCAQAAQQQPRRQPQRHEESYFQFHAAKLQKKVGITP